MIEIWGAGQVFICDEAFSIIHNGGIAFEKGADRILEVGEYKALCARYPHAQMHFFPQGVLLPALINAHVHFEFGAHLAQFCYGDFGKWLDSLMANREHILNIAHLDSIIHESVQEQIACGVGSVGAVSSYGYDMALLVQSPLRVVYFNEAIGSNAGALDALYAHTFERFEASKALRSSTFTPALALHSPYSLHPLLAQKFIDIAASEHLALSAHFLESHHEREWLLHSSGYFRGFFQKLAHIENPKALYSPQSFLDMLSPLAHNPLSLTHCLYAKEEEYTQMRALNASIITCPRSNRLLNNTFLPLNIEHINIAIGTDGKSSNNNLNLLDELRASLQAYPTEDILALAKRLILRATAHGARALGLHNGVLMAGRSVDFALFEFEQPLFIPTQQHANQSPLHFILHAKRPAHLYINAKAVL
ncbi:metal-dependent hydrolase [Helicobacter jaachi]|uniref:Metal-dependent hydrolase n=1 Tax=Helicobacter jaachi TaxID=1677920 RepID=A0A4U8TCU5_9HELI|nr:aminofutalosine deaminase family hydrolase [Helicobacter jaachi]TLD97785.1 metal-dependent hydrolase [Helicobacter jaachi]